MFLPRCWSPFAHFWSLKNSETPHRPSSPTFPGASRGFRSPLGRKKSFRKLRACRQIRRFETRKHGTCAQIHFEIFSQPPENTAPVHKSELRGTFDATWTLGGAVQKHRTYRQIRNFKHILKPLSSKSFGNTAPANKSELRGHFARDSKTRKHRTCPQIRFSEVQNSQLQSNPRFQKSKTSHLCTNLSFEVTCLKVARLQNTGPVHKSNA